MPMHQVRVVEGQEVRMSPDILTSIFNRSDNLCLWLFKLLEAEYCWPMVPDSQDLQHYLSLS